MPISTRIQPIDKSFLLSFAPELSPDGRAKALAGFAREKLAEADRQNAAVAGHVLPHDTFVDYREGASVDSVKPDGTIVFEFEMVDDLLVWISEMLVRHSPVLTGRYSESHKLYADGVEIDINTKAKPADEYTFLNAVPYSRKIEGGPGRKPQSPQAPDGVYHVVATMANRRFGNIARVSFTYRGVVGGFAIDQAKSVSSRGAGKRAATGAIEKTIKAGSHNKKDVRQPAIVVTIR